MGHTRRALVLVLCFGVSCDAAGAGENVGTSRMAIVNGTPSGPEENFTVLLAYPTENRAGTDAGTGSEWSWCTGALVAPNLVLTARHCLAEMKSGAFGCDENGRGSGSAAIDRERFPGEIRVFTGTTRPISPDNDSEVKARGRRFITDGASTICNHDLAFLVLNHPLDTTETPPAPLRTDPPPREGETLRLVGWGTALEDGGPVAPPSMRQRRDASVRKVGPGIDVAGIPVPNGEISVGEVSCEGDSGGPAYDPATGAIVGVVSRGTSGGFDDPAKNYESCVGATNIFSAVASFHDLVTKAFTETQGSLPRVVQGFGASCATDADCDTKACASDPGPSYCSRLCDSDPCPSGFTCQRDNGRMLCHKNAKPKPPDDDFPANLFSCSMTRRRR